MARGDGDERRLAAARKRYSSTSITDFFQRKRPHGARVVIDEEDEVEDADTEHKEAPLPTDQASEDAAVEAISSDEDADATTVTVTESDTRELAPRIHRDDRVCVTNLLGRRELGEFGGRTFHTHKNQHRRLRQLVARWALSTFQCSPVKLALSADWEHRAGRLRSEEFFASCVEFDSAGVLLAAGSSNGIIAIYDFDEYAHRSINAGHEQRKMQVQLDQSAIDGGVSGALQCMHPIHTIFTPFEVQCIRWNPMNEDEIACSFSNRNEIWLFNLRKFPTRPHRVLKSSSHTSSGYNSLVFVPKKPEPSPVATSNRKALDKLAVDLGFIVAGDTVGAIRMWDIRFPSRPIWSISTGSYPVNTIALSRCKREVICGVQSGVVVVYDVHNVSVRAFGSKPSPLRKAVVNVAEAIKPHIVHDLALCQSLSQMPGASGVVSLQLLPQSASRIVCQLRNDWLAVLDLLSGAIVRLFSRKIELDRSRDGRPKTTLPMSVLTAPREVNLPTATMRTSPSSWLGCHRCSSTLLFDGSVVCWGPHGRLSLDAVIVNERSSTLLERAKATSEDDAPAVTDESTDRSTTRDVPPGWLRLPTSGPVTAVASHPRQHLVICGGAGMELLVLGSYGRADEQTEEPNRHATSLFC